jgi:hypothetical protein
MRSPAHCGAAIAASLTLLIGTPAMAHTPGVPDAPRRPWPVTITIQTVPALSSVRFELDGVALKTDSNGRASYTGQHNFDKHTLELLDTSIDSIDRRYRFTRWAGQRDPNQAFRPTVTGLPMRANYTVTAAFAVQYPVSAQYVDQRGRQVDPARISLVTIKSDTGHLLDIPPSGTTWLDGSHPVYRKSVLSTVDVFYSLQSIMVDGTNVVDAGKQRFQPGAGRVVTFTTQFHDLTVTARDALFKGPIGSRAVVTAPDGTVRTGTFGAHNSAHFVDLPRGRYHVTVEGGSGIVMPEDFALSRSTTMELMVLSLKDIALIATVGLLLAAGLLLMGRAYWLQSVLNFVMDSRRTSRGLAILRGFRRQVPQS